VIPKYHHPCRTGRIGRAEKFVTVGRRRQIGDVGSPLMVGGALSQPGIQMNGDQMIIAALPLKYRLQD
jgi:hypothetical protein